MHLGVEPEPLGLFENSAETAGFFDRLREEHPRDERLEEHLGVNYDTCHFAVEFEEPEAAIAVLEEELLHEILDMMACKAAVKAGDPLTQGEIEALLARKDLVSRSSNCPHGRPTTLRLTLKDLEKQFKRTGF